MNYIAKFNTDSGEEYILDIVYIEDSISPFPNIPMYNISFTISEQYDLENYIKYEKETDKGEHFEIVSRLIHIISNIDLLISNRYPNIVYIIGRNRKYSKN